jgi:glycosyltransferase involved in cell wall biosynthesis
MLESFTSYLKSKTRFIYYPILRRNKKLIIRTLKFIFRYYNPYDKITHCKHDLQIKVIDKNYTPNKDFPSYTTITPVLNEEANIIEMLKSLEDQTYKPSEVIIVDGGSTDRTVEIIEDFKKTSKLNIITLHSSVKNIGYQRNLAIDKASNDLLVNVDAGTIIDENYGANVIGPFVEDPSLDLICGVHYAKERFEWSESFSPKEHFKDRLDPYGACIVYKKELALKVGKFPEYVTYAGEDTLFIYKYRKISKKWVFNKQAFILWEHPTTLELAEKKLFNYTKANFEIGLWGYFYSDYIFLSKLRTVGFLKLLKEKQIEFRKNQASIEINKRNIKGLCFIFSNYAFETPEASNLREVAKKFQLQNYKIIFVNFTIPENKEDQKFYFDIDHTLLELAYYQNFRIHDYKEIYGMDFLDNSYFVISELSDNILARVKKLKEFNKNIKGIYYCKADFPESILQRDESKLISNISDYILIENEANQRYLQENKINSNIKFITDIKDINPIKK